MEDNTTNKFNTLKLVVKINVWMCIIFTVGIFIPPFVISIFAKGSYQWFLVASGIVILMPGILFGITWVICIIYKFKKNIAKEIKEAYMLMPIYYIFITMPVLALEIYIINLFMQY